MAVDFNASVSLSTATSTRRAIDSLASPKFSPTALTPGGSERLGASRVSSPNRLNLPQGVQASQLIRAPADISIGQAKQMIANALAVAHKVRNALDTLSSLLNTAGFTSLTDSESAIAPGGTRISGVTIEAAASRIISAIDTLVAGVTRNSINLISSGSRSIRIQTTNFGGRVTVTPQPMDSVGLNINNLAAVDRYDARDAKGRVDNARLTILSSIQNLEALQRSLEIGSASSRNLSSISSPGDGITARGALVDFQT